METNHIGTMDGSETASETKAAIAGKVVVCVFKVERKWVGDRLIFPFCPLHPIACPIAGKV